MAEILKITPSESVEIRSSTQDAWPWRLVHLGAVVPLLLGLLLLAPPADARTVRLGGGIHGDANGTVSIDIMVQRGEPRWVTHVRVSQLNHKCSDGTIRQYTRDFPRRIKIDRLRTGKYVFFDGVFPNMARGLRRGFSSSAAI